MRIHSAARIIAIVTAFGCCPAFGADSQAEGAASEAYNVKTYGATGDGTTKDTQSLQKAIDAANQAGGGTVYFPAGSYLTGTLRMKDHVTLHLGAGATLLGSTDLDDYPIIWPAFKSFTDKYVCQSLIYGEDLHDIAVVGRGTIDGQGDADVFKPRGAVPEYGLRHGLRPYLIRLVTCRKVLVRGITLRDSPMWTQHYLACDDLTVDDIHVYAHVHHNNDMIDIDCCRNVRISNCTSDTTDDGITLKSTAGRVCENVTITNCVVSSRCNAIKCGTESSGGFRNITITNCAVRPSQIDSGISGRPRGLAGLALEIVDGGTLDRITVSNLVIEGTLAPIFLRLGNRARLYKDGIPKPGIGTFRNVTISNVVATGASMIGCTIAGLPDHPIENVTLSNIRVTVAGGGTREDALREIPEEPRNYPEIMMFGTPPAYGLYARHVNNLTLENVEVRWAEPDLRPLLVCDDVQNLRVNGLAGRGIENSEPTIFMNDVRTALVQGCVAPNGMESFLRLSGQSSRVSVIGNDLSGAKTPFGFAEGTPASILYQTANRMPD
ncbi:MAG: glycoside hydrolase family 28 protein [Planctomycetes bacterium]|nr:glycoside hydrolase family 28 protein [Planctomycetota bacterium]